MTKEQFENGTSFKVKGQTYRGDYTFTYDGVCICRESRSSINEEILYSSYHLNISKIGRTGFVGFTFVMDKKVNVKYKFEDLVAFRVEEELI